jgi:hypothetical protein
LCISQPNEREIWGFRANGEQSAIDELIYFLNVAPHKTDDQAV